MGGRGGRGGCNTGVECGSFEIGSSISEQLYCTVFLSGFPGLLSRWTSVGRKMVAEVMEKMAVMELPLLAEMHALAETIMHAR
jgi:hypothetical protein